MKVLHFIWSGNFGGIEKTAIDLAMEQNRLQIAESHILIGCRKGEFLDLLANLKIPHHIGELHSGTDFNPIKIIKICNLIKSFDIIHFHTFNAVVMIASILSGRKIFYTIHGNLNYGKKIRLGDKINNFLRSWFFNRYVDFISFNSNWTKEQSLAKFKITHSRSAVIYNGINLDPVEDIGDTADHDITGQLKNKFVVGTASRFNAGKRIDRLIRAFDIFAENNQNYILLLIGDGEQK